MTVEQDLREALRERAARVTPSPDGWTSITLKIDHRRQRARVVVFAVAALLPVVAVGAILAAVRDGNGAHSVDTAGPAPVPSTTDTTEPAAATPELGPSTTAFRGTTTGPRTAQPATSIPPTARIWPETQSELDEIQKSFDKGHQPWRGAPAGVATAFLADRGLADADVTDVSSAEGTTQLDDPPAHPP